MALRHTVSAAVGASAVRAIAMVAVVAIVGITLAAPAATADRVQAQADLETTLSYLDALAARGEAEDEMAPYLVEAAVAAGLDPAHWPSAHPALSLLRDNIEERANQTLIHRLRPAYALALAGALGPADNVTQAILASFTAGQFGDPALLNDDIWTLMTLPRAGIAASEPRLRAAADHVLAQQTQEGGWSWNVGGPGESDMTGMALEALQGVGRLNATVAGRGLGFIALQTETTGGVALARPGGANCDSTVWSIRAHAAAGTPLPQRAWSYLYGLRNADGSYDFTMDSRPAIICTLEMATLLGMAVKDHWAPDGYGQAPRNSPPAAPPATIFLLGLSGFVLKTLRARTRVATS